MNDRPDVWLNLERDAHRLDRQHDVGKQHRAIHAKLIDGHQRDLRTQVGSLRQGQDRVLLTQGAVARQAAPGLPHEPHRGRVRRLASTGREHALGAGHRPAGNGHPSSSTTSAMLPAMQVKMGVSRSV